MSIETVVIAGSGPAGLAAAIYAARAGLKPLVLEGLVAGGQLTVSEAVENYPGFPEPVSGMELMSRFRRQAERFAVRFRQGIVEEIKDLGGRYGLRVRNESIEAKTVIIATGAQARRLAVPGEAELYGRGVSGCAVCDGAFFTDKTVLVIGGGNTAIQDALFLTRFAAKVIVVHRRNYLRADSYEVDKARGNSKIEWLIPWEIKKIVGGETVTGAMVKNNETGDTRTLQCDGIFVAIGHDPKTEAFRAIVETDKNGYIKVASNSTKTSAPGIFACGDVCDPVYRQAAVAAGQGCMAAMDAQRYIEMEP